MPITAGFVVAAVFAWYWFFERPPAAPVIGRPAPTFQLETLDGRSASLNDFRGRPVVVNFWATWCEPCKEEMPALQAEATAQPDLTVLGVDNVESAVKVKPFVDQLGVAFPILLDQDGSLMEKYQVTGLPTSYFVDRSGTLRFVYRGGLTDEAFRQGLTAIGLAASQVSLPSEAATPRPPTRAPSSLQAMLTQPTVGQHAEQPMPQAREEGAAAAADGKLYEIAGFDVDGKDTNNVFVFDGKSWQPGPAAPVALDHPSAAAIGSDVYLAGGFSNGPAVAGLYRLSGGRWQTQASMTHARGAFALVALGGKLYALGGTAQTEIGPAEVYDPGTNTWSDLPALEAPRDHVAGFVYQNMACIAGGRTPNTPRVDCFDPASNAWQRLPDLPQPTSGAGAISINGDPIVAGGEGDRIIEQLALLHDGQWSINKMYMPRHGVQLAISNGHAYACGGGTAPGLNAVATCTTIDWIML